MELILDNLTHDEGYFTTKMILSHEIYKAMKTNNEKERRFINLYA